MKKNTEKKSNDIDFLFNFVMVGVIFGIFISLMMIILKTWYNKKY